MRRLLRESGFLQAGELFSRLLPLAVAIVVAHSIGTEALVELTIAQVAVNLALVVGDAGLGVGGVRRVAAGYSAWSVIRAVLPVQVAITTVAMGIILVLGGDTVRLSLLLALGLGALGYSLNVSYVLQGRMQFARLVAARVAGNAAGGVLGCAAAWLTRDLLVVALALSSGFMFTALLSWILVDNKNATRATSLSGDSALTSWRQVPAGMAYTVGVFGANAGVILVVEHFESGIDLASIVVAWKVLQLLLIPVVVVESQLLPRFATGALGLRNFPWLLAGFVAFLTIPVAVVSVAPGLITQTLFGAEGPEYVVATRILVLTLPGLGVIAICAAYLLSQGWMMVTAIGYALVPVGVLLVVATFETRGPMTAWVQVVAVLMATSYFGAAVILLSGRAVRRGYTRNKQPARD